MPEFLPLGSVVMLKGAAHRVMIVGRIQRGPDGKVHDYCGVLWPEGYIASDQMIIFDHDQIELLYFIGLQDTLEFNHRFVLEEKYENIHQIN